MTPTSDPFSEAEVTLVDNKAGDQWDVLECDDLARPTEPCLMPSWALADVPGDEVAQAQASLESGPRAATVATPHLAPVDRHPVAAGPRLDPSHDVVIGETRSTLTAEALRQKRAWKRGATDARRSLAERRDQREALSRFLALAKPRTHLTPAPARSRAATNPMNT